MEFIRPVDWDHAQVNLDGGFSSSSAEPAGELTRESVRCSAFMAIYAAL